MHFITNIPLKNYLYIYFKFSILFCSDTKKPNFEKINKQPMAILLILFIIELIN